jgi:hypothetical protein
MNVYFGTYTYVHKIYCDREFMGQVVAQLPDELVIGKLIVDNSKGENGNSDRYCAHLQGLSDSLGARAEVIHVDVDREPKNSIIHRRIVASANIIRDRFLTTTAEWLLLVETDVIPPQGFLPEMMEKAQGFDIFGLPYYKGWHANEWFLPQHREVVECSPSYAHVLSGCTLYSRRLIERFPFRYDPDVLFPCPDSWISYDARNNGFRLGHYTGLKCRHLAMIDGKRGWEHL